MEVAPSHLPRTYSGPSHSRVNNSSTSSVHNHHQSHTGSSSYSTYSHPSRSSNSTQDTSTSTLFPQPPSNTVGASNNVINKVADKGASLFQICMILRNRLSAVPGFEDEIALTEELAEEEGELEDMDPVTLLWRTFRRGYPLMRIYNTLEPDVPLSIDEGKISEGRRYKAAAFKFLQACVHNLNFRTEDCFILSDLYSEDTSGFVKVARVVSRVVDMAVERELIDSVDSASQQQTSPTSEKRTQRQFIVDELVRTERTYVQHLEVLHSFKKFVEQRGVIPGDAIHDIFLNLNALLDFQRRFLIRVEQINAMPEDQQDWGREFIRYSPSFRVYEQYIANQKTCEETAMREYEKLREVGIGGPVELQQLVESPTHLTAFLLKPFQRLSKYPLLLRELRDKGDLDDDRRHAISTGIEGINAVLERTNTFIAQQERAEAVQTLKAQVEDWKEHRIESFGELLLNGVFTVFKNDSNKSEREYRMYLFEKILLCCKDITDKPKNKMLNKPAVVPPTKNKPKMAMKGRIFMQNVTETTFLSKPGHYTCQISWRGEGSVIGNFVVKFPTEEIMKQWRDLIERQRRHCTEQAHRQFVRNNSQSDFNYMQQQQLDYAAREQSNDEEDDDRDSPNYGADDQPLILSSRHGSSSSLLSRTTTNESINAVLPMQARAPPMRYPAGGGPPLTLRTRELHNTAPVGGSYFSPVAESPISSRTSSSSGMTPFPRQTTPSNGIHGDESNRFTAPAHMNRALGRDPHNGYYQIDRTGRPIQSQAMPLHPATLAHTRLRSASSPDVHAPNGTTRSAAPPMPGIPSHLVQYPPGVNRSQNNSPLGGIPPRAYANSPSSGRRRDLADQDRQSQDYSYGQGQDHMEASNDRWEGDTSSPPLQSSGYGPVDEARGPQNYKVKVAIPSEGQTLTLVAGDNITFQALKERIDAKMQRSTNLSLSADNVRLQYVYDDERVNIQTDEDVQTAFETCQDSRSSMGSNHAPEQPQILLYVVR